MIQLLQRWVNTTPPDSLLIYTSIVIYVTLLVRKFFFVICDERGWRMDGGWMDNGWRMNGGWMDSGWTVDGG